MNGVKLDARRAVGIFRLVFRRFATALIRLVVWGWSGTLVFEFSILARFELGSSRTGAIVTVGLLLFSSRRTGLKSILSSSLQSSIVSTSQASLASLSAELLPRPLWPFTNSISAWIFYTACCLHHLYTRFGTYIYEVIVEKYQLVQLLVCHRSFVLG